MLRVKLSVVPAFLLTIGVLFLSGCSSTPVDKTAAMSPTNIYKEAQDEMSSGQWERAVPLLENSKLAQQVRRWHSRHNWTKLTASTKHRIQYRLLPR